MNTRSIETALAYFTLGILAIYVPVETWVSLPYGLLSPTYLIDLVAMALLLFGALHSLRARPLPSPAILCAAYAWSAANAWRAASWRYRELAEGGKLDYGNSEWLTVIIGAGLALTGFAVLLFLVVKAAPKNSSRR